MAAPLRLRAGGVMLALLGVAAALCLEAKPASAQIGSDRYSSIVIEARTGRELSSVNADELRHPASLTKMMTLYMVFEALRDRRISLNQQVPVSPWAASQIPTKLGLLPSTRLTVEEAILGLVTKSANDAATALGEMLGGDESHFAQMMTLRARALGMSHTVFRNASGVPDPDQVSTARDLAQLGRRLVADFPNEYRYFSTPSFRFHGRLIPNHDRMLQTYPGADGIKTGFINASGFNLVTSAIRSDVRLVGVVLGAARSGERDLQMSTLLDQGFELMDVAPPRREGPRAVIAAANNALPIPLPPKGNAARYAVQVGAFTSDAAARQAAAAARRMAEAGTPRVETATVQGRPSYRAQLVGMSAAEANGTCAVLSKRRQPCVVMRPDPGQQARN